MPTKTNWSIAEASHWSSQRPWIIGFNYTPRSAINQLEMWQDETFDPSDAVDFWHLVNQQDWAICERVQKGMASRVHNYGILSPMEDWNLDLRRYVKDRIGPYIEIS